MKVPDSLVFAAEVSSGVNNGWPGTLTYSVNSPLLGSDKVLGTAEKTDCESSGQNPSETDMMLPPAAASQSRANKPAANCRSWLRGFELQRLPESTQRTQILAMLL